MSLNYHHHFMALHTSYKMENLRKSHHGWIKANWLFVQFLMTMRTMPGYCSKQGNSEKCKVIKITYDPARKYKYMCRKRINEIKCCSLCKFTCMFNKFRIVPYQNFPLMLCQPYCPQHSCGDPVECVSAGPLLLLAPI